MTERPSEAAFAAAVNAYMVSRLANNGPFDMDVVLRAAYAVDFPDEEPEMTLTLGATVTRNTLDLGGVPAAIDLRDMLMPVGPDNLTGGVPDEAVQVAFNATSLYGYPLGCGATAIRCVTDMLAVALPHLERAAITRWIDGLTDAQIDAIDDLATKWGNTAPDGRLIHGFDMDRWREGFREGFREGLRRALYNEEEV